MAIHNLEWALVDLLARHPAAKPVAWRINFISDITAEICRDDDGPYTSIRAAEAALWDGGYVRDPNSQFRWFKVDEEGWVF
jgi:hypothetical protein